MSTRTFESLAPAAAARARAIPRVESVGTATPAAKYTQEEVLEWFREENPKVRKLFHNSHIESRGLYLPDPVDGTIPEESNEELIDKHLNGVLELGPQAMRRALEPLGLGWEDIDFLFTVTSTGFLCPGISAHLIKELGLRETVQRSDVVGMGCNAAMNALQLSTATAAARPGAVGVLLCVEVCSAAYVVNDTMATAVVNSLFGDGAAAAVVRADEDGAWRPGPAVLDFESFIHPETIDSMRFDVEGGKLSFFLAKDIPWVIGENSDKPVGRLLGRHGLSVEDVDHWVIHSGGKKVIDAISARLGLSEEDVRHTRSILREHGNVSSASVLFSFERLVQEDAVREGDVGVMIAMGPGMSIETALLAW